MDWCLSRVSYCICTDEQRNRYLYVGDFVRHQGLGDAPEARRATVAKMKGAWPSVLLLQEQSGRVVVDENATDRHKCES
jgi:hypothetical protein